MTYLCGCSDAEALRAKQKVGEQRFSCEALFDRRPQKVAAEKIAAAEAEKTAAVGSGGGGSKGGK